MSTYETQMRTLQALQVENAVLKALSVTNIVINMTPGHDGMGQEIYAKSVDEVVAVLSDMGKRLEALGGRAAILRATIKAQEHWQEQVVKQAAVIEQLREALDYIDSENASEEVLRRALQAMSLNPSPEILQARDEQVAEACAKLTAYLPVGCGLEGRTIAEANPLRRMEEIPMNKEEMWSQARETSVKEGVPEGYQLVPIEPTESMIASMQSSGWMLGNYKAMLSAARSE